ncbi:sensor domain-containing protein [Sulfurimonas sp.]|uniref:sensor domain-containing protein n=1 Tax=Sulfurimonas sp. TaxID=2022749 RepID=UPI003D0F2A83
MLSKRILLHSLDTISDPVFITDETSHFIYVNEAACQSLGYTSKELLTMRAFDIDPLLTQKKLKDLKQQINNPQKKISSVQTQHKRKNGDIFSVELDISHTNYNNQDFFFSIAHNTERRKREQQLLSILQVAIDNASDAVYIINHSEDGKILYTNKMATEMLGYTQNEFLDMYVKDLDAHYSKKELQNLRDLDEFTVNSSHRTKYGEIIDVKISASTFMYDNIRFRISLVKDIREQQRMETELLQSKEEYYSLAENIPMYIVRWDTQGRYLYINQTLQKALGFNLNDIKGKHLKDVLGTRCLEIQKAFQEVIKTHKTIYLERVPIAVVGNKTEIHSLNIVPEFDENGDLKSVLTAGWNMTDVYTLQDTLATKEQEFRTLVETAPGMIGSLYIPADGSKAFMPYVSPNIYELYGINPQDVQQSIETLLNLHHPKDQKQIKLDIDKSVSNMSIWHAQYRTIHPVTKNLRWVQCTFKPNFHPDGGVIFHGFVIDITQEKESEKQKEFLAFYDPLTKLPNRILTKDRMERAIAHAKRDHLIVGIFFIDLDNFKTINDSLGHNIGDEVIKSVAKRLTKNLRQNDTVSRHGGDEFLLIATDLDSIASTTQIAQKIIDLFQESFHANGYTFSLSASIGISLYPENGKDYDTLLKEADLAMYKAKEKGKNIYSFSQQGSSSRLLNQLKIQNKILEGIQKNEFELYYQPQIELSSGKIIGVEALIRWNSKDFGFLEPSSFITIAETSGHIVELGDWIIFEACRQGALWQKEGKKLNLAINISAIQFQRGDLIQTISKSLLNAQYDPKYLELEITESVMMNNAKNALANISVLKGLGIQLSIDDFGTGYSSLSYLKRFDVDKLKIDRSFIINILHDNDDRVIVKSIIKMAKSLGLKTIAEGVEDQQTVKLLGKLGCDEIQGYYYAKPMDIKSFEKYYKKNNF